MTCGDGDSRVTKTPKDESSGGHGAVMHLFGHGRLSYVQIPAIDVRESAKFYQKVFGWKVRGDGAIT